MTLPTAPSTAAQALLNAGMRLFDSQGYAATTVAQLCQAAGVSNGSFFHHYGSKEGLAGQVFVDALKSYHAGLLDGLAPDVDAAAGLAGLVRRHLDWVVDHRPAARFLFEQHRAEWLGTFREAQAATNADFAGQLDAWRAPWVAAGQLLDLPGPLFFSQLIGPAQMLCRAWLSRPEADDPRRHALALASLALRALLVSPTQPAPSGAPHDH